MPQFPRPGPALPRRLLPAVSQAGAGWEAPAAPGGGSAAPRSAQTRVPARPGPAMPRSRSRARARAPALLLALLLLPAAAAFNLDVAAPARLRGAAGSFFGFSVDFYEPRPRG